MNSEESPMSLGDFQTELTKLQLWASHGCRDGDCQILRPVGMHTNGGCRCSPKNMADRLLWLACELEKYGRRRWPKPVSNPTKQNTTDETV